MRPRDNKSPKVGPAVPSGPPRAQNLSTSPQRREPRPSVLECGVSTPPSNAQNTASHPPLSTEPEAQILTPPSAVSTRLTLTRSLTPTLSQREREKIKEDA